MKIIHWWVLLFRNFFFCIVTCVQSYLKPHCQDRIKRIAIYQFTPLHFSTSRLSSKCHFDIIVMRPLFSFLICQVLSPSLVGKS